MPIPKYQCMLFVDFFLYITGKIYTKEGGTDPIAAVDRWKRFPHKIRMYRGGRRGSGLPVYQFIGFRNLCEEERRKFIARESRVLNLM